MSGRVVHFEIPADDMKRAQDFYSSAFGWEVNEMPGFDYAGATTVPTDEQGMPKDAGAINGGMFPRKAPLDRPMITIDVEDIEKALATVKSLGGSTVTPKEPVGDMGYVAYFKDSEGNLVGMWQNA
jgi:predicted enzyme related to lactoylglutathione lyase